MGLLTTEHSKVAYIADFVLYGVAAAVMGLLLVIVAPYERQKEIVALALLGLVIWTLVEYLLHRFVLHGLQPFRNWHADHHRRPRALIGTPTILSSSLIAALVFLPALLLSDIWRASALTFGLLSGYLVYAIDHHTMHHWHAENTVKRLIAHGHTLHHHHVGPPAWFGVTSPIWDFVFGTCGKPAQVQIKRSEARAEGIRNMQDIEIWEDEGGASQCSNAVRVHIVLAMQAGARN